MPVRRILPLTLLALLLLPSVARASSDMEFALQDDDVFVHQQGYDRDRALDHALALGVTRIRVNVLWARTLVSGGASKPVYDFSAIDALQEEAQDYGIDLQLTIAGPAPSWATRDHKVGNIAPDPKKYAAFVREVVTHFKGEVEPLLDLERAELEDVARAPEGVGGSSTAGSIPRATGRRRRQTLTRTS